MGGHGGLNILPQKSWNVYGQRNRQKVAEDEKAEREKQGQQREQQTRGDRVARVNVLRNQVPAQELHDSSHDQPEQLTHINFWSDHEAANRNPEAEAEKAAQLRKRGDPKTQTSDARFDERFAVLHGHTAQAPWYAKRAANMYSESGAAIDHSRSSELASVRSLIDKSKPQRLTPRPPRHGLTSKRAAHGRGHSHASRSADRTVEPSVQPHSTDGHPARAELPASGNSAQNVQRDTAGKDNRNRSWSPRQRESHQDHKHKRDRKHKKHKHRSRDRDRERSRSPQQPTRRSIGHKHPSRRRHRSPSDSSDSGEGRGAGVAKVAVAKGAGKPADGFEALRQERLERERLEAARSRQLLREHFSRG